MSEIKSISKETIVHRLGELTATLWNGNTPLEKDVDKYINALMGAIALITEKPLNEITFGSSTED